MYRTMWLAISFMLVASTGWAQPGNSSQPWHQGISTADRHKAEGLFTRAVELHSQLLRNQAVVKYQEALTYWENPHIRWNLALALKEMGLYLQAHENLERVMSWGLDSFDKRDQEHFLAMRRSLLQKHLAVIEARCDQSGVEVALDGKPWFVGPGVKRKVVRAGEHVITAKQAGYFPLVKSLALVIGKQATIELRLSVDGIAEKRKWAAWKPWAVVAAGLAAGLAGAGLAWQAHDRHGDVERSFVTACPGNAPCDPTSASYHGAIRQNRVALGAVIAGGVLAATGATLVILNRPRSYRTEAQSQARFKVIPIVSDGTAGLSIAGNWSE